jgi:hypothetical protein
VNGNVDVLRLMLDVGSENDIGEPLFAGTNRVEGLAQKGVVEYQLAHLLLVALIRPKATEQHLF